MNSKQLRTLEAVCASPTLANIAWRDIERLLAAAGCLIQEGPGSAVTFVHAKGATTFHRPHPGKEARKYQVRQARDYLADIGVTPCP